MSYFIRRYPDTGVCPILLGDTHRCMSYFIRRYPDTDVCPILLGDIMTQAYVLVY